MTKNSVLTQARLRELFHYSPETGEFTRLVKTASRVNIGDIAGCDNGKGYLQIGIDSKLYFAHRLAFLYMLGEFPDHDTDHVNHVRHDNRWKNLRACDRLTNRRNASLSKNNTSGVTGVSWARKSERWYAQIMVDRKVIQLGLHLSFFDACRARKSAEIEYGFHKNHGKPG